MKTLVIALLSSGLTLFCYYSIRVNVFITEHIQSDMPHINDLTTETLLSAGLSTEEIRILRKLADGKNSNDDDDDTSKNHKKSNNNNNNNKNNDDDTVEATFFPTIDILSVGSITQQDLQVSQLETLGAHKSVRYFYGATEEDDTEASCYETLTLDQVKSVTTFCRQRTLSKHKKNRVLSKISQHFFSWSALRRKKNPVGWLCAQKRPFDAFYNMIQRYNYRSLDNLPDYLLVMDDDTWVNLDNFVNYVPSEYPVEQAHVVAGCMMVTNPRVMNLTVPFGGYGIIFNKRALENLLQPLHCGTASRLDASRAALVADKKLRERSSFERLACWRMSKNLIGERTLFKNGMSIADLMHAYAVDQPFKNVEQWNSVGFCMHSDWLWAYMANYYHLAMRPSDPTFRAPMLMHDRLVGYNHSHSHPWTFGAKQVAADLAAAANATVPIPFHDQSPSGECLNGNDLGQSGPNGNGYCGPDAHFCHRITPMHMRLLHTWNEKLYPQHYAPPTTAVTGSSVVSR